LVFPALSRTFLKKSPSENFLIPNNSCCPFTSKILPINPLSATLLRNTLHGDYIESSHMMDIVASSIATIGCDRKSIGCAAKLMRRKNLSHGDNEFDFLFFIATFHHIPYKIWKELNEKAAKLLLQIIR